MLVLVRWVEVHAELKYLTRLKYLGPCVVCDSKDRSRIFGRRLARRQKHSDEDETGAEPRAGVHRCSPKPASAGLALWVVCIVVRSNEFRYGLGRPQVSLGLGLALVYGRCHTQ